MATKDLRTVEKGKGDFTMPCEDKLVITQIDPKQVDSCQVTIEGPHIQHPDGSITWAEAKGHVRSNGDAFQLLSYMNTTGKECKVTVQSCSFWAPDAKAAMQGK